LLRHGSNTNREQKGGRMLRVGNLEVGRGEKRSGVVSVVDNTGASIEIPVVLISGVKSGPVLWINAGIHGTEYPGIEAAIRISRTVTPEELTGTVIVLPIVNTPAFFSRTMYECPIDNKNLNRVFPGKKDGSMSEALAFTLMKEVAPEVTHVIDLHGGDTVEALHPFAAIRKTGNQAVDEISRAFATYYGTGSVLEVSKDTEGWTGDGTLFATMAERGIPALLAEAGGVGQLDEDSTLIHYEGAINIMKYLGMLKGRPEKPGRQESLDSFIWLYSGFEGIFYPHIKAGETVEVEQSIGEVRNFFGEVLEKICSPVQGRLLVLVDNPAVKKEGLLAQIGRTTV